MIYLAKAIAKRIMETLFSMFQVNYSSRGCALGLSDKAYNASQIVHNGSIEIVHNGGIEIVHNGGIEIVHNGGMECGHAAKFMVVDLYSCCKEAEFCC